MEMYLVSIKNQIYVFDSVKDFYGFITRNSRMFFLELVSGLLTVVVTQTSGEKICHKEVAK